MKKLVVLSVLSLSVTAIHTREDQFRLAAREANIQKTYTDHPFAGPRPNDQIYAHGLQRRTNTMLPPVLLQRRMAPLPGKSRTITPKPKKKTPYSKAKEKSKSPSPSPAGLVFSHPKMPEPVSAQADVKTQEYPYGAKRLTRHSNLASVTKSGDLKDIQIPEAVKPQEL